MVELALDTGFGTQSNFSRVFRKLTGLTPRQYRDMQPPGLIRRKICRNLGKGREIPAGVRPS